MKKTGLLGAVTLAAFVLGACAAGNVVNIDPEALTRAEPFVAIERGDDVAAGALQRAATGAANAPDTTHFYVAIRKADI